MAKKKEAGEAAKICSSCGANIAGKENFSQFACPSCAKTIITRCAKCKTIANLYKCAECGFEGP